MKDLAADRIRNVCLMSHGGAGKTTLAEAMLFNTGVLERFGKVEDGTTTSDYDPEEIKRKSSISTSICPCEWKNHKINVIDTPGYFDFVGEVKQGIRVADSAVILVSAKSGVAVGTEKAWSQVKERNIPKFFFVNKMDDENANFFKTLDQLVATFGKNVIAFQIPIVEDSKFTGYVNIITMKASKFDKDKLIDADIPSELNDKIQDIRNALIEAIAETSEELMEKFFDGQEFTVEEISAGLRQGIKDGSLVPVFCGSAVANRGVKMLMDSIVEFMPSPVEAGVVSAKKAGKDEVCELKTSEDAPLSALVFKTIADPFVGKISMIRVFSGTLKSDSTVYNTTTDKTEKISQLFILRGKKNIPIDKLVTGDIGAVAKLQSVNTNDTLCTQENPVVLDKIQFPEPVISMAVKPTSKGDEDKIGSGLNKLQDEDPTFKVSINNETHQTLISGVGEIHLDVIVNKLKSKFGVSVELTLPKVPYRETIKKKVKVEGKHKKQSGGHGQYGHVWIEFEPGDREQLTFEEKIFGGAVPKQYFPAVEKGLQESIRKGVLAGYPVVFLKATLVDGSYHSVDSSEMAFKVAANLAYKKGLEQASPVLLEPIAHVEVYVPESYMGEIIGDLNKRRGRILGMNPQDNGIQQVVAEVPQAEMFKYATDLTSMTQGRGMFKMWFERYEEAPPQVSQKVIEEAKKNMSAADAE
ncbi:elongation factor G [Acetivibrio mesophilus]|uniref:Elongation factor G n=1 Tax=Acetivibrio mesophilus TaxID=2487273 RepID=A0A4Q0I4C1_9FIRM|nr:elongation factor G [Acetivibrio mesophilus]ODM26576.1 translation elongation factor G [Clostridium sp. Bc-iso-3]RXE58565.1 elongation factor G [Acetivibrio mesophilus]